MLPYLDEAGAGERPSPVEAVEAARNLIAYYDIRLKEPQYAVLEAIQASMRRAVRRHADPARTAISALLSLALDAAPGRTDRILSAGNASTWLPGTANFLVTQTRALGHGRAVV